MLRPVGFIGTPLPSHYATLCPPLFSPPPAGPTASLTGPASLRSASRSHFHPPIPARPWYVARDYRQLTYTWLKYVNKRERARRPSPAEIREDPGGDPRSGIFSRATSNASSDRSIVRPTSWCFPFSFSPSRYHYDVIIDNSAIDQPSKKTTWRFTVCVPVVRYDNTDYRHIR